MIDKLMAQLTLHEDLRLKPYRCSKGKLTIGIGRNLDDRGISKAEAEFMARNDINEAIRQLKTLKFWPDLTENRQMVLIDMVFNLGWPRFLGFKKTIALIADKKYNAASAEMLNSKWHSDVGQRAETLAQMMRQG
jgi:lysozyme